MWLLDPWNKKLEGAPLAPAMREEILKYRETLAKVGPKTPQLDSMTMEAYMMTLGLSRETIRTFYTPGPADGWGLGPDVISAYCGVTWGSMNRGSGQTSLAFPGGNDGIGRHMVKTLIPTRDLRTQHRGGSLPRPDRLFSSGQAGAGGADSPAARPSRV